MGQTDTPYTPKHSDRWRGDFAVREYMILRVHLDGTLEWSAEGAFILFWRTCAIFPEYCFWQGRAHRAPAWMRRA